MNKERKIGFILGIVAIIFAVVFTIASFFVPALRYTPNDVPPPSIGGTEETLHKENDNEKDPSVVDSNEPSATPEPSMNIEDPSVSPRPSGDESDPLRVSPSSGNVPVPENLIAPESR